MAADMSTDLAPSASLGRAMRLDDAQGRYLEFVKATFPTKLSLEGLKVVVDCANGAAYRVAPTVLWELGAEVVPVGVEPDGFNINRDCGSTASDYMCEQVVAHKADIGIALDGDADRLVVADEHGTLVDGDQCKMVILPAGADWMNLTGGTTLNCLVDDTGDAQCKGG